MGAKRKPWYRADPKGVTRSVTMKKRRAWARGNENKLNVGEALSQLKNPEDNQGGKSPESE